MNPLPAFCITFPLQFAWCVSAALDMVPSGCWDPGWDVDIGTSRVFSAHRCRDSFSRERRPAQISRQRPSASQHRVRATHHKAVCFNLHLPMKSKDKQYSQHLRYQPLSSGFYENTRESLRGRLPANCVAFLASSQQVSTNADGIYPFVQESNLFYLTGIEQPSVRLMLYPDHPAEEYREVLFLERGNAETQRWDGPLLDFGQASAISGIANVLPLDEFEKTARAAIIQSDSIGLRLNEHPKKNLAVSEAGRWLLEWCGTHFPQHPHFRLYGPMRDMRMVKRPEEIEQIRRACDNICEGFAKALKFTRPGIYEFEVEAELMAHIMRNRSRRFAFDPIVASGGNSYILHYSKNNSMCKDGGPTAHRHRQRIWKLQLGHYQGDSGKWQIQPSTAGDL